MKDMLNNLSPEARARLNEIMENAGLTPEQVEGINNQLNPPRQGEPPESSAQGQSPPTSGNTPGAAEMG